MGKRGRKKRQVRKYKQKYEKEIMKARAEEAALIKQRKKKNRFLIKLEEQKDVIPPEEFEALKLTKLQAQINILEQELEQTGDTINSNMIKIDALKADSQAIEEKKTHQEEKIKLSDEKYDLEMEMKQFESSKRAFRKKMRKNMREAKRLIKTEKFRSLGLFKDTNVYQTEFYQLMEELEVASECPLLFDTIATPVMSSYGHIYESHAITRCKDQGQADPIARRMFIANSLRPHYLAKNVIDIYKRYLSVSNISNK